MPAREVNQTEFAALLGLTTRQVRNLESQGLPHRAEGNRKYYPIPDGIQWYANKQREDALSELGQADYKEARARREAARARMAEINLAKEEGRLLPRDVVKEIFGDKMLDRVRAALLNFPGRWGAQVVGLDSPREGEAILKQAVSEILEELSGPAADDLALGSAIELPDSFPGRSALVEAGIESLPELLEVDELLDIHGVGPVTKEQIEEALDEFNHVA